MGYDKFRININGKVYLAEYRERNGDRDASGFGYRITDPKSEQSVGYLRVLIYGTAMAIWKYHTKYPYSGQAEAEKTVKTAIKSVLSSYKFEINQDYFDAMSYRGDNVTVQITTLDDAVDPNDALITLKSYESPEEFVAQHLFGSTSDKVKLRRVILQKISQWEDQNYGQPYSTKDLQAELFLDRATIHRTVDYLAGPGQGYIQKSPAGDDEYNLRLNPAGDDYLDSVLDEGNKDSPIKAELNESILQGLIKLDKSFGDSYVQVIDDLNSESRKSWKGTANELRELVGSILRHLAPDDEVIAQAWYKQLPQTTGPTQKQRVKFILAKRNLGSKQAELLKELESFDDRIATFGRKLYDRANNSTHQYSERKEISSLHNYFVAFMGDLLDIE